METDPDAVRRERFAHLPDPVRPEDLRIGEDPGPEPYERGAHDTETSWLLRTAGLP